MLIAPLNDLPWTIGGVLNGIGSYKRIKKFLNMKDISPEEFCKTQVSEFRIDISPEYISQPQAAEPRGKITVRCKRAIWPTHSTDQHVSFAMKQIDYTINPGELHVVIGKVSSGKTAFLHLLLNELEVPDTSSFTYTRCGSVAYAGQTHWLQKGTIKVMFVLLINLYD